MSWRPENWGTPCSYSDHRFGTEALTFEAGADAMLAVLRKECDVFNETVGDFDKDILWEHFNRKANGRCGYLVFIPDDLPRKNIQGGEMEKVSHGTAPLYENLEMSIEALLNGESSEESFDWEVDRGVLGYRAWKESDIIKIEIKNGCNS